MTFNSRQVSPLNPSTQKLVSTANGTLTPVIGEGSLTLTDTLNLDFVLVVSYLDYNLLSVSQITHTLSCVVIFGLIFVYLRTSKLGRRLVVVLGRGSYITWTWNQIVLKAYNKL